MKVCNSCCEQKKPSEFHRKREAKDGLQTECKSCRNLKQSTYHKGNKSKRKAYMKKFREERPSYYSDYYHSNKLKRNKYSKWYGSIRRANKNRATPSWLTEKQLSEIQEIYWLASDLRRVTGEEYHVDHIVPLKGKNVCGLHVPWNLQILPSDLNLSKGNFLKDN